MGVARIITIFLIVTGKLSDITSIAFTVSYYKVTKIKGTGTDMT